MWQQTKQFLTDAEMAAAMIAEAREYRAKQKKGSEKEKLKARISSIESQTEALAERLSQLPKTVSPTPIFKQMEKLESFKIEIEIQLAAVIENGASDELPVDLDDLNLYRRSLSELLDRQNDPQIQEHIISKFVERINVTKDGVDIDFMIGKNHYSRELALAG